MPACALFGHADETYTREQRKTVMNIMMYLISYHHVDHFYIRNRGNFDELALVALNFLAITSPHIKTTLVMSNMPTKQDFLKPNVWRGDFIAYPTSLLSAKGKNIINETNKRIIEACQYVIFAVKRNRGGAYNAYRYALKKNKNIFNIYSGDKSAYDSYDFYSDFLEEIIPRK